MLSTAEMGDCNRVKLFFFCGSSSCIGLLITAYEMATVVNKCGVRLFSGYTQELQSWLWQF